MANVIELGKEGYGILTGVNMIPIQYELHLDLDMMMGWVWIGEDKIAYTISGVSILWEQKKYWRGKGFVEFPGTPELKLAEGICAEVTELEKCRSPG